jgi:mRNA interferase HicA
VKRVDLIRRIRELDAEFVREGGEHTYFRNPRTGKGIAVPRHREIKEGLSKKLLNDAAK